MTNCVTVDTVSGSAVVRSRVLAAVHDELIENGYRAMSMSSLAARAGVTEEEIQSTFVSRESVLVAHLDRMNNSMLALLGAIARSREPLPTRVREVLLARVVFRFDVLRPYRRRLEEMREPLLLAIRRRGPFYVEQEARILERLLGEGQRAGLFACADPEPLARTLLIATNALLPGEANLGGMPPAHELSRTAGQLIDIVLDGALRSHWNSLHQESPRIDATAL